MGGALLGQKKYAEAEPLLVAGCEGLKRRETAIPLEWRARLTEALERLVECYVAWNKPDEADTWRKRVNAHKQKAPGGPTPPGAGGLSSGAHDEPVTVRVPRLIQQLGHDDFSRRERASKELDAIGEPGP